MLLLIAALLTATIAVLTIVAAVIDSRAYDHDVVFYDSSHKSLLDHLL